MHGGLDMEEEEEAKSEGEEAIVVEGRGEGPRQISNGSRTPRKSGTSIPPCRGGRPHRCPAVTAAILDGESTP